MINKIEKCLLIVIVAFWSLAVCAQCYHAGHKAGHKEAFQEMALADGETCSTDTECEATQE